MQHYTLEYLVKASIDTHNPHSSWQQIHLTWYIMYSFRFIFSPREYFFGLKDLAPYMGFGGGRGAAPAGLNRGGGVRSFRASRERFLTTLL